MWKKIQHKLPHTSTLVSLNTRSAWYFFSSLNFFYSCRHIYTHKKYHYVCMAWTMTGRQINRVWHCLNLYTYYIIILWSPNLLESHVFFVFLSSFIFLFTLVSPNTTYISRCFLFLFFFNELIMQPEYKTINVN